MPWHLPFLAAGDGEAIIWLIILVFWGISSLINKVKEKKAAEQRRASGQQRTTVPPRARSQASPPPPPPRHPAPASDPAEELRRFLEEITGKSIHAPEASPVEEPPVPDIHFDPPSSPPQPAPVTAHAKAGTIVFDPPLLMGASAPLAQGTSPSGMGEIKDADHGSVYDNVGEMEDIEDLMNRQAAGLYSGDAMMRQDSLLINLSRIQVPLMTLPLISYKSVRYETDHIAIKSSRHALRDAMVARVILSPCKALEHSPSLPDTNNT